jgi:hypothetical protein
MAPGAAGRGTGRGLHGMSARLAAWLAWCMCAASLVLMVLGLLLLVTSRSRTGAPVYDYWLVNTVIAIGFSTVGAVITPLLPRQNPIGWLFCTIGLVGSIRLFAAEYAIVTLLAEPGSLPSKLPGGELLGWVSSWVWVLHLGLFVFLALLFPDGRPPSSRWRPLVWGIGVVIVSGTVSVALWPETVRGFDPINRPLGTEVATDIINPVETIVYALGLIAAASLLTRLRGSKGVERQQVKWFTYAVAMLAISATLAYVVSDSMGAGWLEWVSSVLVVVGVVGLPVAVGIAILRYHLFDIDLIINRTLVYVLLTAVLAGVYLASIVVLQLLFRALTGGESQLVVVASTLAIAALFNPLRHRIQGFIDHRFYRRKYDAAKTLEAFSTKLRDETNLGTLSDELVGVVRETMQPAHVSLWLRQDPPPNRGKGSGEPHG